MLFKLLFRIFVMREAMMHPPCFQRILRPGKILHWICRFFPSYFVLGLVSCTWVFVLSPGCSPKREAQAPEPEPEPRQQELQLQAYGEFGVLNENDVRTTFERVWKGPMTKCQRNGGDNISGMATVRMRINHQGAVKWVYFKETNLGDYNVESCMLRALREQSWPIPQGGDDGLAEQELEFADYASRAPIDWDPAKVQPSVDKYAEQLRACRQGHAGDFIATAIIDTNGSVASVGVQQPDETATDAALCMVKTIRAIKFPTPGSWPAKVLFSIP